MMSKEKVAPGDLKVKTPTAAAAPASATPAAAPGSGGGKAAAPAGKPKKAPPKPPREVAEAPLPFPAGYVPRLYRRYQDEIVPALRQELGIKNRLAAPRLTKVVVSMGLGKAIAEKPRLEAAVKELTAIAGQKAVVCQARKSVSNFKLREGMEIGAKVTLRGRRMWEFLDRLITLVIPRVKDFRGLPPQAFDGRGNYNLGLAEQTVFPEVRADQVTFHQGLAISIVTTGGNDRNGFALLRALGFPFRREESSQRKAG